MNALAPITAAAPVAFCPCCGYDLAADVPIETPAFRFDPRGAFVFRGVTVRLTPYERIVLDALLRADGRTVSESVLRERTGQSDDSDANCIQCFISKIRKKLHAIEPDVDHIETIRCFGWRWVA